MSRERQIEAGETALIEYEYASRKYGDYSHKAAAEAVIAAALALLLAVSL